MMMMMRRIQIEEGEIRKKEGSYKGIEGSGDGRIEEEGERQEGNEW